MISLDLEISERLELTADKWVSLEGVENLKRIPKSPGVYVLHHGKLADAWKSDGVFYIGATHKENLRTRAGKHRAVLLAEKSKAGKDKFSGTKAMKAYGGARGNKVDDVYFSYFKCDDNVKRYIPFVLEAALLLKYESEHEGAKPQVNRGGR